MGDGDQRASASSGRETGVQVAGEPVHALDVEVVGGFVEDDDVGVRGQHRRQGDPPALAAREGADPGIEVDVRQQAGVDVPHRGPRGPLVLGRIAVHGRAHGGAGIESVGLGEHDNAGGPGAGDPTAIDVADARERRQESRLAGAVGPQDAHAAAVADTEGHVVQEDTRAHHDANGLGSQ